MYLVVCKISQSSIWFKALVANCIVRFVHKYNNLQGTIFNIYTVVIHYLGTVAQKS